MSDPFTLRVFVPSGDPEGSRIVEKMNWTGRGYHVPRDDWPKLRSRPELQSAGVYILIGREEDELGNEMPVAYIGQAEDIRKRLDQHDASKEFWDQAMFFISANNGLNRAHITWLEWSLMAKADHAKRCRLENGLTHSEPMLTESEKADVRSFLNEMLRLMPVMGVHIFEVAKTVMVRASAPKAGTKAASVADVLVVPAKADGFQSAFLESNAWWAIRVAAKHRPNLKWIAAYQVLPVGAVTHIAEIDRFEPYGDEGKYKVVFKGAAVPLPEPIRYGNAVTGAMQGPRYCTKAALDSAKSVADLVV
jgi:hypothetical protein